MYPYINSLGNWYKLHGVGLFMCCLAWLPHANSSFYNCDM